MSRRKPIPANHHQRGVAVVEFALVSSVFFMLLLGAVEMGRLLFYWNATVEGTRAAARTAVVCNTTDTSLVRSRVTALVPSIPASGVDVSFGPSGCSASVAPLCDQVTISIKAGAVVIPTVIPFVSFSSITMPAFSTTLTTESLQSAPGGTANPACS